MDLLKSKTVGKKGRKAKSKVQQFYSEYNTSASSSSSPSRSSSPSSENDAEVRVFTFENIRSPRNPNRDSAVAAAGDANNGLTTATASSTSNSTSRARSRSRPTTPGVTKNQRIKDEALSIVYQNKIKGLRSNWAES